MSDERQEQRFAVAIDRGFGLYDHIYDKQLCGILGVNRSTTYRWREEGILPYRMMGDKVFYLGYEVADLILDGTKPKGKRKWQNTPNENSRSATTGSASGAEAPHGTGHSTTPQLDAQLAYHLARKALK